MTAAIPAPRALLGSVALAALVAATGCSLFEEELPEPLACGAVVDVSGSSDKGAVVDRAAEWITDFLADGAESGRYCGKVTVTAVIHNSEALTCSPVRLELTGSGANAKAWADTWERNRAETGFVDDEDSAPTGPGPDSLRKLQECAVADIDERSDESNKRHSDILGALRRLTDEMDLDARDEEFADADRRIAVVSDGEHNAELHFGELDLSSADSRAAAVEQLATDGLLPDLTGTEVAFYGLGSGLEGHWSSSEVTRLKEFWRELAVAAGATGTDEVALTP